MAEASVFNQDPNSTTLAQSREWLDKESRGTKGADCPCCGKNERTHKRKVTPVQAAMLVMLYRTYQIGDAVNIHDFAASLSDPEIQKGRDWGRLVYWDLLEPTSDEKVFRLCDGGYFFVFKGHMITEKAWVRNEVVVGREGKAVNITQVLSDKFDINTLQAAQTPTPVQLPLTNVQQAS